MAPNTCIIKEDEESKKKLIVSAFDRNFWDLWLQKLLRNVASVKYQWLFFLYILVVYGIFDGVWVGEGESLRWVSKISPIVGLSFLGGGFVTLAGTRLIAKTSLTDCDSDDMNTDK